ncbi:hypothetical protein ACWD6Z_32490, partial [Streptomyces californicus]
MGILPAGCVRAGPRRLYAHREGKGRWPFREVEAEPVQHLPDAEALAGEEPQPGAGAAERISALG